MSWNEHTNICTYRVKAGAREEFLALLQKHWPTLHEHGLVTDTPALHFEAKVGGKQHNESGTTFTEILSWKRADGPELAHHTPAVMAIWEPMGALVEEREGHPGMEFPAYVPVTFDDH